jgi:hypothetical protein
MALDPYWGSVVLNLQMDGVDSSSLFVDDKLHTMTPYGNVRLSTTQKKHGTASGFFDGSGDYLRTSSADFSLPSDFTVELWAYIQTMPTSDSWPGSWYNHSVLVTLGSPGAGDGWGLLLGATTLIFQSNDSQVISVAHNLNINSWHHLAITRTGNIFRLFIDGVLLKSVTTSATLGSGSGLFIGGETGEGAWFSGYLDDIRITKGVSRYTSDFTPPVSIDKDGTISSVPGEDLFISQTLTPPLFRHNPSIEIREKYSWQTSVIFSWEGEERTQLRDRPSLVLDYRLHITSDLMLSDVLDFYTQNILTGVRIPLWSTSEFITGLFAGDLLIPLAPSSPLRAYLEAGSEILLWKTVDRYEVCVIDSITSGELILQTPLLNGFQFCYILPCLQGFLSASPIVKSSGSKKSLNFSVQCNSVLLIESPSYSEFSLFDLKPLISSDFSTGSQLESDLVASPIGVQDKLAVEGLSRQSWSVSLVSNGLTEITEMKQKLAWFRGRAKSLIFPFTNLLKNENPYSLSLPVCLTEDSITFNYSKRLRCTTAVSLLQTKPGLPPLLPFPDHPTKFRCTCYDWDRPLLGGNSVMEDPPYPVDGHVTLVRIGGSSYLVIEVTGNLKNLPGFSVGSTMTNLPWMGDLWETPEGKTGIGRCYG